MRKNMIFSSEASFWIIYLMWRRIAIGQFASKLVQKGIFRKNNRLRKKSLKKEWLADLSQTVPVFPCCVAEWASSLAGKYSLADAFPCIYVTAVTGTRITADTRDTGALGKRPPQWGKSHNKHGGIPSTLTRGSPWGGPMTMAVSTPQERGYTPNHSMTQGEWRPIQHCYHPTVQCWGRDPHGVPLPGSDWKQEAPDQWCNALCITWWWTYDINKGESHDYLL